MLTLAVATTMVISSLFSSRDLNKSIIKGSEILIVINQA